jgi:hypothetical protein
MSMTGLAVAALAAVAVVISARADERAPVLHEDLVPPKSSRDNAVLGPSPTAGQNPTAIESGNKLLPEPDLGQSRSSSEPLHGSRETAAKRPESYKPDRQTGADGTLHYTEVFNPSIVPFKRMVVLDSVHEDYTLYASSTGKTFDVPVGGQSTTSRDRFWASMAIVLETGEDVPIPSVSPDMRILSYEVEPKTSLVFSKDDTDNFYVRSDEAGATGTYRLVFLVDASPLYFAPQVPRGYRVRDIPKDRIIPLPEPMRPAARRAMQKLGLRPSMELTQALNILTRYFRAFAAQEPPPPRVDIFTDLFDSKAGVCRHRSFAFVVVASELGIPSRYVANEAHAWVEVWVPESGWLRIDLGGAALRLEVSNAENKSMYQPRGDDPFDKPKEYQENYTRLEGDVRGLSESQIAEAQAPRSGGSGEGDGGDEVLGDGSRGSTESSDKAGDEARRNDVLVGPGPSLPDVPEDMTATKAPTAIQLDSASSQGFRGETMTVSGSLTDSDGNALAGQRINIFLAHAGMKGENAQWVGQTLTNDDGTFTADVELPRSIELGEYEVFASSPGDDNYRPSVSR